MHVDAHQHFWKYDPAEYGWIDGGLAALRRDFLPGEVAPAMARAGFDRGVAVQARQTLEETRFLLDLADRHAAIAGVVGWVDLCAPDAGDQIARFASHPRLCGLRHSVQSEPDDRFLLRPDFQRGLARLAEFGLAYDLLIYPRHLPVAAELVERFPAQPFVVDHLAKPEIRRGEIEGWRKDLARLAAFPNVSAKLSGLVTEAEWGGWTQEGLRPYLDVAWDCFGPARLMAGSDWPVSTVAGDYERVMAVVHDYLAGKPAAEREAVLGGNAVRFWRLEERSR